MFSSEIISPPGVSKGSATGSVLSLDSLTFKEGKCLLKYGR